MKPGGRSWNYFVCVNTTTLCAFPSAPTRLWLGPLELFIDMLVLGNLFSSPPTQNVGLFLPPPPRTRAPAAATEHRAFFAPAPAVGAPFALGGVGELGCRRRAPTAPELLDREPVSFDRGTNVLGGRVCELERQIDGRDRPVGPSEDLTPLASKAQFVMRPDEIDPMKSTSITAIATCIRIFQRTINPRHLKALLSFLSSFSSRVHLLKPL